MIINGGSRKIGAFFAKHLTNGEHNERVTLCEMRGLAAETISGAFREMEAVAMGTLCKNYFYHANINPRQEEGLSTEQWNIAVDTLEKNLALPGHARFVVEHFKAGRTHRHVVWSRINVRTMRAAIMTDDYEVHQETARVLEKAFGLKKVPSVIGRTRASGPRPSRRPKTWESFRGQKSGINPFAMKQAITQLYHDSGHCAEFVPRLADYGLKLVRGDNADFLLLDSAGHLHSLARRIDGVYAADLREFMKDIAVASLPYSGEALLPAES